jgi:L-fuconolactonase
MTQRIDAHQHYWNPARGDYGWMPKDDPVLARPYCPSELEPQLAAVGIMGTVLVQAAPTVNETEYMLGIADSTPSVLAVVGWIDFEKPNERETLERLAMHWKFKGARPMIQDIPDDGWMLRDDVQWGFAALAELGLSLDALGFPQHLGNFLTLLTRHPDLRCVIDHAMKPRIRDRSDEGFRAWADGMARIAAETGAFCKLSGLVTEASPDWSDEDLRPVVEHLIEVFGPERIMWGSDWPVCRLRCEFGHWHETAERLTRGLSADERAQVFGGTAATFYGL